MPTINPMVGIPIQMQSGGGTTADVNTVSGRVVVDRTPVRVATIAISAAIGLLALKWAGFRFNVGVS